MAERRRALRLGGESRGIRRRIKVTSSSSTLPGLGDQSVLSYRVQVLPQSRTRDRCALGVPLVWLCDLCLRTRKVLRVWPESVPGSVIFFLGCFPTLRTVTGNLDCV